MEPLTIEQVDSASGEQLGVVVQVGVRFKAIRRWHASGFRNSRVIPGSFNTRRAAERALLRAHARERAIGDNGANL